MAAWIDNNPGNLFVEREYALRLIATQRLDQATVVLERLIAIEFMTAVQALEFRKPLKSSDIIEEIVGDISDEYDEDEEE